MEQKYPSSLKLYVLVDKVNIESINIWKKKNLFTALHFFERY